MGFLALRLLSRIEVLCFASQAVRLSETLRPMHCRVSMIRSFYLSL